MKIFSQRLREAMESAGLDPQRLSELTGISRPGIYQYLNDVYSPKKDRLDSMAAALRVSPDWLVGKTDDRMGRILVEVPGVEKNPDFTELPIIGQIACGSPILAEENVVGMALAPVSFRGCYALKCKGDSMKDARIMDGDIVYIRPQPDVEDGQIAAVLIGDEATLKRVYRYPGVTVLRAANPDFPDQVYTAEQFLDVRIIGLAVGFSSRIK